MRSISTSVSIESMSEWAQLLFDRIVIHVDDFGRIEGDPIFVKATTKPLSNRTPAEFAAAITEMIRIGAIAAYTDGRRAYLHVSKHDEHQSGLHKRTHSKYPEPSAKLTADEYLACVSGTFREIPGNSSTEEKRKEEKGKGTEEGVTTDVVTTTTGTPEERKGAQDRKVKKQLFEIPENFQPTTDEREWAREQCGLSDSEIARQTERFVRHHRAKGNRFKRPDLAWRNWITGRFTNGTTTNGKPRPKSYATAE